MNWKTQITKTDEESNRILEQRIAIRRVEFITISSPQKTTSVLGD